MTRLFTTIRCDVTLQIRNGFYAATIFVTVIWGLILLHAGVALAAALYCLAGFIVVARYTAVNEYLLPSGAYIAALWIPLIADLAQSWHWLLYLHPISAPLALIRAAFEPAMSWQVWYG